MRGFFTFLRAQFQWIGKDNILPLAIVMANSFWYYSLSYPISKVISDQLGDFHMAMVLMVSSAFALLGYPITGWLNCRWGSDRVSRWVLPFYALNLLFFFNPAWIPWAWLPLGLINSVAYTAIDALFRQRVRESTKSVKEAETAIGTKEFLCHASAGMGSFLAGVLVSKVGMWSWITLVLTTMCAGYVLIWQVKLRSPQELCKEQKPEEESSYKPGWGLYMIAMPYLGIALANAAFSTFLQLDIGVLAAGMVLLVNRFATAFANLLANKWYQCTGGKTVFRWSIIILSGGILLIPLGNLFPTGISLPFYIAAGVLIGGAASCCKLIMIHMLQRSVPPAEQGKATAPLMWVAEVGFLIAMPAFGGLSDQMKETQTHSYTLIWIAAATLPILAIVGSLLTSRRRSRKR